MAKKKFQCCFLFLFLSVIDDEDNSIGVGVLNSFDLLN
jgi:hypothetical protein